MENAFSSKKWKRYNPWVFNRRQRFHSAAQPLSKEEFDKQKARPENYHPTYSRTLFPFPLRKKFSRHYRKETFWTFDDQIPFAMLAQPGSNRLPPGELIVRVHAAATLGKDGSPPRMQINLASLQNKDLQEIPLGEADVTASVDKPQIYEFRGNTNDLVVAPSNVKTFRLVSRYPQIAIMNVSRSRKSVAQKFPGRSEEQNKRLYEKYLAQGSIGANADNLLYSHKNLRESIKKMEQDQLNQLHIDAVEIIFVPESAENAKWVLNDIHSNAKVRNLFRAFIGEAKRRDTASPAEVKSAFSLFRKLRKSGLDRETAIKEVLASVLIDIDFLFINAPAQQKTKEILQKNYQFASRLSYFLWNSPPDQELIELAAGGDLTDHVSVANQVRRMLKDSRAKRFTADFSHQWLRLDRFSRTSVMEEYYPEYDDQLASDIKAETLATFNRIFFEGSDARELIAPKFAMLNQRLARHYDIKDVHGGALRAVPAEQANRRGGLLRQASLLTINGDGIDSHPVRRGVWIKDRLLGDPPPPPPPNLDTDLSDAPELSGLPLREKIESHRSQAACKFCHAKIDPWGIALEAYDATGGWRDHSQVGTGKDAVMHPINAEVVLPSGKEISNIDELEHLIAYELDNAFTKALAKHMMTYALGHELSLADEAELVKIHQHFLTSGFRLPDLVLAIVQSEAFRR